jgi:hypothetical protein
MKVAGCANRGERKASRGEVGMGTFWIKRVLKVLQVLEVPKVLVLEVPKVLVLEVPKVLVLAVLGVLVLAVLGGGPAPVQWTD